MRKLFVMKQFKKAPTSVNNIRLKSVLKFYLVSFQLKVCLFLNRFYTKVSSSAYWCSETYNLVSALSDHPVDCFRMELHLNNQVMSVHNSKKHDFPGKKNRFMFLTEMQIVLSDKERFATVQTCKIDSPLLFSSEGWCTRQFQSLNVSSFTW